MLHCVGSLAALLGRLKQRRVLQTLSPCYLGEFATGVYLNHTCDSSILVLEGGWLCSTLVCIVSGQHRELAFAKKFLRRVADSIIYVTDLPRSVQVIHVALIISSYPLTW